MDLTEVFKWFEPIQSSHQLGLLEALQIPTHRTLKQILKSYMEKSSAEGGSQGAIHGTQELTNKERWTVRDRGVFLQFFLTSSILFYHLRQFELARAH